MESTKPVAGSASADIEADIQRLEAGLRQLKVQYDMFFSGALKREPLELRAEVERLIKRYANAPIRKYATRFHFTSLATRFSTLSELWSKTLRSVEEAGRPVPAPAERPHAEEQLVAACHIRDPRGEEPSLRLLHAKFLEARKKAGAEPIPLSFEGFVEGIARNVARMKEKAGCDRVELRVIVRDRKVHLKARPGR